MKIEEIKLTEIKPYENNPRKNDAAVESVAESIRQFGFKQPIVVDKDNVIVAGHTRYKAAKKLKLKTAPCVRADDLTDEQVKAYRILDNKVGELATWDFDALYDEMASFDFDFPGFDFDTSGFSPEELATSWGNTARDALAQGTDDDQGKTFSKGQGGDLAKDFIIPPLSVLNSRSGDWSTRRGIWQKLLNSGAGRKENLVGHWDDIAKRVGGSITGTSIFDPCLCEILYQWFCPPNGAVLDPFAGGSVRGVIAGFLGRRYVGIDLSATQVEANERTNDSFKVSAVADHEYVNPVWICDDARHIARIAAEYPKFDFLISCPPYFDLEQYGDDPKDLSNESWEDFIRDYRQIFKDGVAALKDDAFIAVVVGEVRDKRNRNGAYRNLVGETITALQLAGAEYYNECVLVNRVTTAAIRARKPFEGKRKIIKVHQNVLIFIKGDAKKATEKLGDVEQYFVGEEFESENAES